MDTMESLAAHVTRLRKENEDLHEEVYFWKSQLSTDFEPPREWLFTPSEGMMFRVLLARPLVSRETFYSALYGPDVERDHKIIDVWLSRMRVKLKPFGIVVHSVWGRGWHLDEATRKRFKS